MPGINGEIRMTLDEIKEIANKYESIRMTYYTTYPKEICDICDKLKALGREWGDKLPSGDFHMYEGKYYITNSKTHYHPAPDEWTIHWDNGNIGRLQFIHGNYYFLVEEEWNAFLERMREGCLDYDPSNCHIVYDIETGKKVMEEYKKDMQ